MRCAARLQAQRRGSSDAISRAKLAAYVAMAREKTGLSAGQTIIAGVVTLTAMILLVFGPEFFVNAACFVYPSKKTLEAWAGKSTPSDATFWVTYWWLFNLTCVSESVFGFNEWVPIYPLLKMLLLVWCFHQRTRGAQIVYDNLLSKIGRPESSDADDMDGLDDDESVADGGGTEAKAPAGSAGAMESSDEKAPSASDALAAAADALVEEDDDEDEDDEGTREI